MFKRIKSRGAELHSEMPVVVILVLVMLLVLLVVIVSKIFMNIMK